ncbi:MAG: UvrD-helicase domain-containing protein [Phycisphaerales bacterium]
MSHPKNTPVSYATEEQERERLAEVVRKIEAELRAFGARLGGRLTESYEIAVAIQEQKRDMDHAEKAFMRQSVNVLTSINEEGVANYNKLLRLVEAPYFGRIDLASGDGETDQPVYVGLNSFADPHSDEQLVHDWRAPISSMFYDFELGPAHYEAPSGRHEHDIVRKRQYQIEQRQLKFMLDTALSIQDDILREALSRSSDDKMKNIVATIQREQNAIIRDEDSRTLIIQGAAGSGKTSIALHRIAYLLYRFRDTISSNEVLVVSPNGVFADYISKVLPEMGEQMVLETTMESIASVLLGAGFKIQTFAEQVAILLDAKDEKYAQRVRDKSSPEFLAKLDAYIAHMRTTNFTPAPVSIPPYTLDADFIAAQFKKRAAMPIRDQITRVIESIVEHMSVNYQKKIAGPARTQLRKDITAMFRITALKPLYKDFYKWLGSPEMFKKAKGGRFEYADVFPLIYLARLVETLPALARVKHVVIDEMQDYTPIQYRVIEQLFNCNKTILGDRNQAVSPLSSTNAESIRDALTGAQCVYMHKSYRSSLEITALSQTIQHNADLESIERHDEKPVLVRCVGADEEAQAIAGEIDRFRQSDHNTMGIICKTDAQATELHERLAGRVKGLHLLDARSTTFSGGVMIATAYLAKGLEFDRVVVPDVSETNYNATIDRHMLYVACTRAMHRLTLTTAAELSPFLRQALDGDILEIRTA